MIHRGAYMVSSLPLAKMQKTWPMTTSGKGSMMKVVGTRPSLDLFYSTRTLIVLTHLQNQQARSVA
jgi:hypothetical protein